MRSKGHLFEFLNAYHIIKVCIELRKAFLIINNEIYFIKCNQLGLRVKYFRFFSQNSNKYHRMWTSKKKWLIASILYWVEVSTPQRTANIPLDFFASQPKGKTWKDLSIKKAKLKRGKKILCLPSSNDLCGSEIRLLSLIDVILVA
jgi:hypothetical protein